MTHWSFYLVLISEVSNKITIQATYHNDPKYLDTQACVKSIDPDQMSHNVASDQGLYSLPHTHFIASMVSS